MIQASDPTELEAQPGAALLGERYWGAALHVVAAVYIGVGLITLVFDTSFSYPVDLRLRWIEQGLVYQGLNPQDHTYPAELVPDFVAGQRDVRGSYPPWSYGSSFFLSPPGLDWGQVRVYFAIVNAVALAVLAWALFRLGEQIREGRGRLAVVSALAAFSVCVCLSYGQYSIIVTTLIVGGLLCLERQRLMVAGVLTAVAAVKPHLAFPFFLVPLVFPFSWWEKAKYYIGAASYLAIASFAVAGYVGSTPWDMLAGTASESVKFYHLSNNPLIKWSVEAFGFSVGSKVLALVVASLCAVILALVRRGSLLAGYSVCAVTAFYWSYSRHYDLVLLAIPLLYLISVTVNRASRAGVVLFLLMGLFLWSPIRISMSREGWVQLVQAALCLMAIALVIRFEGGRPGGANRELIAGCDAIAAPRGKRRSRATLKRRRCSPEAQPALQAPMDHP